MRADAKQRASDKLARLAGHGLDLVSFWRESTEVLASAVPHYWAPCWFTLDPASVLVTSHFDEGIPELPPQWLIHEYYDDDVNKLADVARSERGISTLHEATGGDPTSSPRWYANMALGGDQELIAALAHPRRRGVGVAWAVPRARAVDVRRRRAGVRPGGRALPAEGHAGRCWSAKRSTPRDRTRLAWSCSHTPGRLSRPRPA
jgi:hypothetical protein